jgi:UDP-GlcNAc:undecaprenyl-phosphate GlcNAc-1-phosphate transferase
LTFLYLGTFALSLLFSFVLTRLVRNKAVSHGWVSLPTEARHLHETPLPRLGGVAVYLSFLVSVAVGLLACRYFRELGSVLPVRNLLAILIPGTLIFLLGVYDDIHGVGPYLKFTVQALAAIVLFAGGLRILGLPILFGTRHFPWAMGLAITILWVIGITNAFNLIDGLDGLAAGSALFSTLVVFVVSIAMQSRAVSLPTIALAGSMVGFLRFNFNPATIFLGDCGSLFIGFMLSALALEGMQKGPTIIAVAIPVVSFGLPILETALSVVRRLIAGKPVFTGDREHIHHKLLQRGLSHRQVVIVLYAISALFALLSLFLLLPTGRTVGLVLAVLGTGVWFGVQHLGYLEFGEIRRVAQRTLEQRGVFINNLSIRRAMEELKATDDYVKLCGILEAAFSNNDFDGFDLRVNFHPKKNPIFGRSQAWTNSAEDLQFQWNKPGTPKRRDSWSTWNLTLDLVTTSNRRRGSISIYRLYTQRALLLDINLLTSIFPIALADALDRALTPTEEMLSEPATGREFMPAEAG